jgi:hypothetical protein
MLLDTSGLLCLSHRAELYHFTARSLYRAARRKLTHRGAAVRISPTSLPDAPSTKDDQQSHDTLQLPEGRQ